MSLITGEAGFGCSAGSWKSLAVVAGVGTKEVVRALSEGGVAVQERWQFGRGPNVEHDVGWGLAAIVGASRCRQHHRRKVIRINGVEGRLGGIRLVAQCCC